MPTRLTDTIGALQPPCSTHRTRSLQLPRSWGLCSFSMPKISAKFDRGHQRRRPVGLLSSLYHGCARSSASGRSHMRVLPPGTLCPTTSAPCPILSSSNKKLSYRRGTARCVVLIEILPIATKQCRNYLYDKS